MLHLRVTNSGGARVRGRTEDALWAATQSLLYGGGLGVSSLYADHERRRVAQPPSFAPCACQCSCRDRSRTRSDSEPTHYPREFSSIPLHGHFSEAVPPTSPVTRVRSAAPFPLRSCARGIPPLLFPISTPAPEPASVPAPGPASTTAPVPVSAPSPSPV